MLDCPGDKEIEENLEAIQILGNGTFGLVYKCYNKALRRKVALKKLFWNASPLQIYREIESLMTFTKNNCRNVLKFINLYRCKGMVFIEMDYHHHHPISTFLFSMTNDDILKYMKDLLTALCDIHALGYMHCDVKPSNFLFNFNTKKGFLCDFGLCEKQKEVKLAPTKSMKSKNEKENMTQDNDDNTDSNNNWFKFNFDNLEKDIKIKSVPINYPIGNQENYKTVIHDSQDVSSFEDYSDFDERESMKARRGGTKGYRAPEVLWKMENQTTAIDIWSAGIIFLTLLSKRNPFLSGKDDLTDLYEISCIVGRQKIQFAALMCGKFLALPDNKQENYPLKELVEKLNPNIHKMNVPDSAFDLLEKMLDPSPSKRITAKNCLQHPYFTSLNVKFQ